MKCLTDKVELRYDEHGIHLYEEGKAVAVATEVQFHDNAHVKRKSLSFKAMTEGSRKDV